MNKERFNEYLKTTYVKEIIDEVAAKYILFRSSTIKKKDEILRKMHLIALLCNTIMRQNEKIIENMLKRKKNEEEEEPGTSYEKSAKRQKLENIATESIEAMYNAPSPSYNPVSPDYSPNSDNEEYMDDWEEIAEKEKIGNEEIKEKDIEYRFYSPLLLNSSNFNIMSLLSTLDIKVPQGFAIEDIDIIDVQERVMIMILNKEELHLEETIEEKYSSLPLGFVYCNWEKGDISIKNAFGLNIAAAKDFMAQRIINILTYFPEIGLTDVYEVEIISSKVKEECSLWSNEFMEDTKLVPIDPDPNATGMPPHFPSVTVDEIIELLEDIEETRKDMKEASWNGIMLPFSRNNKIIIEEDMTDIEMINAHFPEFETMIEEKCIEREKEQGIIALNVINKIRKNGLINNFQLIKTSKNISKTIQSNEHLMNSCNIGNTEIEGIMSCIGWGMKKKKRADDVEGARQPEYKTHEKRAMPQWMEAVYYDECKESGFEVLNEIEFEESPPLHPIDKVASKACTKMKEMFVKTNTAVTVAKYMNVGSRLAGSYLISISKENKMHSSIAIMPIYVVGKMLGHKKKKVLCGFIIRGPHHVRDGTDKINIMVIERIKEVSPNMLKTGFVFGDSNGYLWFVSRNATTKADPIHNAFLHDLLFLPTNYIGDIIFQSSTNMEELMCNSDSIVEENEDFLKHRLVELAMMGMLGGSQEEGYFSGYRMLYMVLLELSRGNGAGLVDVKGFIEGLNECLISNALVLFLHASLRRSILYVKEVSSSTSVGFHLM